jgi:sarcosine oxidase
VTSPNTARSDKNPVVVIGAGVMGAASARELARSGHHVVVLEQFRVGHKRGSSHGPSRIFRLSYPDPTYVRMAQAALPLWRDLEGKVGDRLVTTTGGLDCGPGIDANADALEACGAAYELTDGERASRSFPALSLGDMAVLFQPDAGVIAADAAVAAFVKSAAQAGADVREHSKVEAIRPAGDGVEVRVNGEVLRASVAVVTAGAWARPLLAEADIELGTRVTRETVAYFKVGGGAVPTLVEWGSPAVYSLVTPGFGIKAGEHIAGPTADPDEEGPVDAGSIGRLSEWVAHRFVSADRTPHHAETCLYTNTPDEHFVLERHGPVVVGSACSGHGFKFAPEIGRRLAALAEAG